MHSIIKSNTLQHGLLELPLHLLALLIGIRLAMQVEKSTKIELGCFEELDLSDVDLHQVRMLSLGRAT